MITMVLGAITALLMGVIGFKVLGDVVTSRASSIAPKTLSITEITESSAKVKWTTDIETQSVVEYGTAPTSLTFFAPEAAKLKTHEVELNLLSPGATYYFQVKVGDQVFDNGGVPWTFTTLAPGQKQDLAPAVTTAVETPMPEATTSPLIQETPVPTTATSTTEKDTACNINDYKARFYTREAAYDQDGNGVVNLQDWSVCKGKQGNVAPTTAPIP